MCTDTPRLLLLYKLKYHIILVEEVSLMATLDNVQDTYIILPRSNHRIFFSVSHSISNKVTLFIVKSKWRRINLRFFNLKGLSIQIIYFQLTKYCVLFFVLTIAYFSFTIVFL